MMEDPNIEDGALIKLVNVEDVTQLDRALEANGKKRLPEIINFKRVQSVTVDTLIGKYGDESSAADEGIFDDLDDLNYMLMEEG